jgi:hypothetical protein
MEDQEENLKNALMKRRELKAQLLKETKVICTSNVPYGEGCGKATKIGKLVFYQQHWYVKPSGCTDGDYWVEDDGHWVCPSCLHVNRMYEDKKLLKLKYLFLKVEDEHK